MSKKFFFFGSLDQENVIQNKNQDRSDSDYLILSNIKVWKVRLSRKNLLKLWKMNVYRGFSGRWTRWKPLFLRIYCRLLCFWPIYHKNYDFFSGENSEIYEFPVKNDQKYIENGLYCFGNIRVSWRMKWHDIYYDSSGFFSTVLFFLSTIVY